MSTTSQANREWKEEAARRQAKLETSRNIPSRFAGGSTLNNVLIIDKGNILETGQDGCLFAEDPITEVPSAYDPEVDDSFIDGICRGWVIIDGVLQDGYVLILNDGSSSYPDALKQDDRIYSGGTVSKPVAGGGSVTLWVAG
ncbi:MAG TPA: hypothetical protein VHX44_10940 [Planctomycetota bacterium]|jgi:hypothetical protein|nr:hypothetical protein [Planctomycetota bacterium]